MLAALLSAAFFCSDGVDLTDVHRFGVCRGICECNRAACSLHLEKIVKNFEHENARMAWWWRQDVVLDAWTCLSRAMDGDVEMSKRIESLARLRTLIGIENYNAGRIYPPVPNYGVWMPVK